LVSGAKERQCGIEDDHDSNRRPDTRTPYNCFPLSAQHTCEVIAYAASTSTVYTKEGPPTGPLPNGEGNAVHEELDKQFIAGVETVGVRD
jgi:hypothetical protein